MTALLFDTETTGRNSPEIIEAAWLELDSPAKLNIISSFEQRYKPTQPIELGALATHHIYDEELAQCPQSSEFKLPATTQYLIGHNIDYDWEVSGQPDVKRICTLAISRSFYPEIDSHSQSALMYLFDRANARERLRNAHSAMADVYNCLIVLHHLIKHAETAKNLTINSWESLWQLSEQARIPTHMPFGKHKGMPISQVPEDYKNWLLRQTEIDPYLVVALQQPHNP